MNAILSFSVLILLYGDIANHIHHDRMSVNQITEYNK